MTPSFKNRFSDEIRKSDVQRDVERAFSKVADEVTTVLTPVKTSAYSAKIRELVRVNPTGGGFVLTLPSAVGLGPDDGVVVKNVSASTNAVTVDGFGSQTIDGAANYSLALAYGSASFVSDGANWMAFPAAP